MDHTEREAVILSIAVLADELSRKVEDLKRFVILLQANPCTTPNGKVPSA